MVPADSRRIPRAPRYSGYHYASVTLEYRAITVYGTTFQSFLLNNCLARAWSYNPTHAVTWVVWANPRSLATEPVLFRLAFASDPHLKMLNLAGKSNS